MHLKFVSQKKKVKKILLEDQYSGIDTIIVDTNWPLSGAAMFGVKEMSLFVTTKAVLAVVPSRLKMLALVQ